MACTRVGTSEMRIVSLSPSTTEAIAALSLHGHLVGRTRFCNYPPQITNVPVVGGYVDANVEAIVALRPTLVVGAHGPGMQTIVQTLETQGIATYFPETESVHTICTMIEGLGARTARVSEAKVLSENIRTEVETLKLKEALPRKLRTLMLFGLDPIVAAGPQGYPHELLTLAGAQNALSTGPAYPSMSLEQVAHLDPDVILDTVMGGTALRTDAPGWDMIRAVRNRKVIALHDEALLRPGPRVAQGLRTLMRTLREAA